MAHSGMNNFQQAFGQNQTVIDKTNFINQSNTIHNNLGETINTENINEYFIRISSADRTIPIYPSPFKFSVIFGQSGVGSNYDLKRDQPPPNNIDSIQRAYTGYYLDQSMDSIGRNNLIRVDGGVPRIFDYYNQPISGIPYPIPSLRGSIPSPTIPKSFTNVKFISIDSVSIPRTLTISLENQTEIPDSIMPVGSYLSDNRGDMTHNFVTHRYRFLRLRIKEINPHYQFSSNPEIESTTFTLIPDKCLGADSHLWIPLERNVTFKTSSLTNITKLTFELLDPDGNELKLYNKNGYDIDNLSNNVVSFDFFNNLVILNQQIVGCQNFIRGLSYTNKVMQVEYNMILGVVETNLNTLTGFNKF